MKMLFDQKVAIVTPLHQRSDEELINERISEMNKEGWDLQNIITEQAYDLSTHESPPKLWNQWQQWTLIFRRPVLETGHECKCPTCNITSERLKLEERKE